MQSRGRPVRALTGGGKVPSFRASEGGDGARTARMTARRRTRNPPYNIADYEKFADDLRPPPAVW